MTFFKKKRVELGTSHINSYTIFESKHLFSIIIYNWKIVEQNRFHTHAFPAYAFLLSGKYAQEVMNEAGAISTQTVDAWMKPRFLPRNYCHRILEAVPNTWTIVFVGPWQRYWYEYFEDTKTWVKYTWGRRIVSKGSKKNVDI